MKTVSEIIQECCEGLNYNTTTDGDMLSVAIRIDNHVTNCYFSLGELNARIALEESLSRQLTQSVKSLKQTAHVLKRGDVIREYKYGTFAESTIISDVVTNERGQVEFVSETADGVKINYMKHQSSLEVQGL